MRRVRCRTVCASVRNRGVGMVEVLVAMTVLSVGLLGVASMQIQAMRSATSATHRVIAVQKAAEVVERMRVNPLGVVDAAGDSSYNFAMGSSGTNNGCGQDVSGEPTACTPAQMAADDYYNWINALDAAFVNMQPDGSIVVQTNTPFPTVTVTVTWTERDQVNTYSTTQQL